MGAEVKEEAEEQERAGSLITLEAYSLSPFWMPPLSAGHAYVPLPMEKVPAAQEVLAKGTFVLQGYLLPGLWALPLGMHIGKPSGPGCHRSSGHICVGESHC